MIPLLQLATIERKLDLTQLRYHVETKMEAAEVTSQVSYGIVLRFERPAPSKDLAKTTMHLVDYVGRFPGRVIRQRRFGSGTLEWGRQGLPAGFSLAGVGGPLHVALLLFALPGEGGISHDLGGGISLLGVGTPVKDRLRELDLQLRAVQKEKTLSSFTGSVKLAQDGWPSRGTGKLTAPSGTVELTLRRQ